MNEKEFNEGVHMGVMFFVLAFCVYLYVVIRLLGGLE